MRRVLLGLIFLVLVGCSARERVVLAPSGDGTLGLSPDERLISIVATNDIHGEVEPAILKDQSHVGGLAFFAGVVDAIREGLRRQYDDRASLLLVDAGDQFQGTLVSNFNEGVMVLSAM